MRFACYLTVRQSFTGSVIGWPFFTGHGDPMCWPERWASFISKTEAWFKTGRGGKGRS